MQGERKHLDLVRLTYKEVSTQIHPDESDGSGYIPIEIIPEDLEIRAAQLGYDVNEVPMIRVNPRISRCFCIREVESGHFAPPVYEIAGLLYVGNDDLDEFMNMFVPGARRGGAVG